MENSGEAIKDAEVETPGRATAPVAPDAAADGALDTSMVDGPLPARIMMAEVAQHNNEASCWTAIRGTVYDITAFIDKHPGGDRGILRLCGIDGTERFENEHGGQKKPEQTLTSFEIGALAN